jgi:hypothetical protein
MQNNSVQTDTECCIEIGEFCCALRFNADAEYARAARDYFGDFISQKEPDIEVTVTLKPHGEGVIIPSSLFVQKVIEKNCFDYHNGLLKGSIDTRKKRCSIEVDFVLLGGSARIFEQFLFQLYYTLVAEKYGSAKPVRFLLHSSSVVRDGTGYVFVGPSGSGKSTIAGLSSNFIVLNDEMSIISKDNELFSVQATPFNGYFRQKKNLKVPLRGIYFIKQAKSTYVKKVPAQDCITALVREMIPFMGILTAEHDIPRPKMIECALDTLAAVPFYELHFLPDDSFWKCIERE